MQYHMVCTFDLVYDKAIVNFIKEFYIVFTGFLQDITVCVESNVGGKYKGICQSTHSQNTEKFLKKGRCTYYFHSLKRI